METTTIEINTMVNDEEVSFRVPREAAERDRYIYSLRIPEGQKKIIAEMTERAVLRLIEKEQNNA